MRRMYVRATKDTSHPSKLEEMLFSELPPRHLRCRRCRLAGGWQEFHSQSALFRPSVCAFSDTARFMKSLVPSGNSAEISTTTFTEAFGSDPSTEMISSAI